MQRDEYIQVMGDLMVLALQTDLTRVSSMMVAPERWDTPLMFHGIFDKPIRHHGWTHNQNKADVLRDLERLDVPSGRVVLPGAQEEGLGDPRGGGRALLTGLCGGLGAGTRARAGTCAWSSATPAGHEMESCCWRQDFSRRISRRYMVLLSVEKTARKGALRCAHRRGAREPQPGPHTGTAEVRARCK